MKALFYGISVATLAGLAIGGALRPSEIAFGQRTGGPQIALADSGRRAYADGDYEAASNPYPYGVPDYVTGTDYLQSVSYEPAYDPEPAPTAARTVWRDATPDLPMVEPASYQPSDESHSYDAMIRYPSQGGGILAGVEQAALAPGEPEDLGPDVFEPADAPPAAMASFQASQATLNR
jgi:hypothetical protein